MACFITNKISVSPQQTFLSDSFFSGSANVAEEGKLRAVEPNYKETIAEAGLRRRMSRIVKMGVSAGLACANGADGVDAIITATGLGCLADTEKFLDSVVRNDESLLNPTAFIQSTFNTIGAQIALILKNSSYNVTYAHRGFSFESALLDAMLRIEDGDARNVLVGAMDEITDLSFDVMERLGFWRNGAVMGEGANFFLLSGSRSSDDDVALVDVATFMNRKEEAFDKCVQGFLSRNNLEISQIDVLLYGSSDKSFCLGGICSEVSEAVDYKQYCGEFPTASSFAVWLGAEVLKKGALPCGKTLDGAKRVLVCTDYQSVNCSLILLEI